MLNSILIFLTLFLGINIGNIFLLLLFHFTPLGNSLELYNPLFYYLMMVGINILDVGVLFLFFVLIIKYIITDLIINRNHAYGKAFFSGITFSVITNFVRLISPTGDIGFFLVIPIFTFPLVIRLYHFTKPKKQVL